MVYCDLNRNSYRFGPCFLVSLFPGLLFRRRLHHASFCPPRELLEGPVHRRAGGLLTQHAAGPGQHPAEHRRQPPEAGRDQPGGGGELLAGRAGGGRRRDHPAGAAADRLGQLDAARPDRHGDGRPPDEHAPQMQPLRIEHQGDRRQRVSADPHGRRRERAGAARGHAAQDHRPGRFRGGRRQRHQPAGAHRRAGEVRGGSADPGRDRRLSALGAPHAAAGGRARGHQHHHPRPLAGRGEPHQRRGRPRPARRDHGGAGAQPDPLPAVRHGARGTRARSTRWIWCRS